MATTEKTSPGLSPPTRLRYLDGVVEYLWDAKNLRGLICLVERWRTVEKPTKTGRLYQIRAFLALRLMDRAWLHLKKMLAEDKDDTETLAMATEMFLDRGWPSRAKKLLTAALDRNPQHKELQRLLEFTTGPPRTPPANAREVDKSGSSAELLDLAERFLATGSFLRARGLLERVRQAEPRNGRVKDLLWGLDGDFDAGDISPEELASQLAPTFQNHGTSFVDLEPPGFEEVTATRIPLEDDDAHEAEFPALFRRVGSPLPIMDDETGEVTQARTMASPEELLDPASAPRPQNPDALDGRREDTEIMMVISSGGLERVDKADASVHTRRKQDYDLRSTLDLQEYRREMGVRAPSLSDLVTEPEDTEEAAESPSMSLEDEDADLVVVTRREGLTHRRKAPSPPQLRKPIRVIEKHPTPEIEPENDVVPVGPRPMASPTRPRPAPHPRAPPPPPEARRPPSGRPVAPPPGVPPQSYEDDDLYLPRRSRPGLVFLTLVLLAGLVALGWWALPQLALLSAGRPANQASKAIASDRYDALLKVDGELERHLTGDAGMAGADPELLAAAARVELALWSEFQPYPERRDQAHELVERALDGPDSPALAHLAAAELAAWEWRVPDAQRHLEAYAQDDAPAKLVRAALWDLDGQPAKAVAAARQAVDLAPGSARAKRVLTQLELANGDIEAAQTSLLMATSQSPNRPRLAILALLIQHQATPAKLPTAAQELSSQLAKRYTPPRVEAELFERVARALPGNNSSAPREWALQKAFAKDSADPDLLLWFARRDVESQHLLSAHEKLERAVLFRPGDIELRRALVRLLVDLDRMDLANQQADLAAEHQPNHRDLVLLRAWPMIMDGLPHADSGLQRSAATLLAPLLDDKDDHGEARWLLGLATLASGEPGALAELTKANQLLLDDKDPAQRELVSRALATLVLAGHPGTPTLLEHLQDNAQEDPWVHLFLAWHELGRGARSKAALRLAQAVESGPEMARAHYEQGAFHGQVIRDERLQREAWRRYLRLEPSGARAATAAALH